MLLLFFYLFLALFISFLCSIMESVLLSSQISFLKVKEREGNKAATKFIKLKENIERPLSAILSLNTVAHTIGAAGVGAQATMLFGEVYFGLVSAILTFLILIFSEIIPKTIGARYWKKIIFASGSIIRGMVFLTYPLVLMSAYISKLFAESDDSTVSRAEISELANMGTEEGVFNEGENKIIQNLIRLRTIKVSEIMTPRVVLTTANESLSLKEFIQNKDLLHFSRIPIFSENEDNITGYILRQEAFEKMNIDNLCLKDIRRKILMVNNTQTLMKLWENLLKEKEHIALIVDEYGGIDGILTMEDIIETLLGLEIIDEGDTIIDMQKYARERWEEKRMKYNFINKKQSTN